MTIHRPHGLPCSRPRTSPRIVVVRGQRVLFDSDLGRLYGVPTRSINQAVARNPDRFPDDFSFVLSPQEVAHLKSQSGTSSWGGRRPAHRFWWCSHRPRPKTTSLADGARQPRHPKRMPGDLRAAAQLIRATATGTLRQLSARSVSMRGAAFRDWAGWVLSGR
jgi:hypothetical protein